MKKYEDFIERCRVNKTIICQSDAWLLLYMWTESGYMVFSEFLKAAETIPTMSFRGGELMSYKEIG